MKKILLLAPLLILFLCAPTLAVDVRFNTNTAQAQPAKPCPAGVNCDPFNTQGTTPAKPPVVTAEPVAPVVNITWPKVEPDGSINWLGWTFATIGGLLTLLFGKQAFKPAPVPVAPVPSEDASTNVSTIHDVVKDVFSRLHGGGSLINDPNLRVIVDQALLTAVQSGVPGEILKTGAGFIPGAGGIAGMVEPLVRKAVIDLLQQRAGGQGAQGQGAAGEVDVVALLKKLINDQQQPKS